jgi:hypothetical protein
LLYVFIACLTFGIGYSAVSAIFGAHGFDHSGVDHGGFNGSAHGHGDTDSSGNPSFFNPLVIASAIATFGAVGIIGKAGLGMSDLLSTVIAMAGAGVIGAAIFFGIVKFMYGSQSNSTFSLNELIGMEAEVITPVPEKGMGEIAYYVNGARYNLSARSLYGKYIARGATVNIKDIQGNLGIVTQKVNIEEYTYEEDKNKRSLKKEKE